MTERYRNAVCICMARKALLYLEMHIGEDPSESVLLRRRDLYDRIDALENEDQRLCAAERARVEEGGS